MHAISIISNIHLYIDSDRKHFFTGLVIHFFVIKLFVLSICLVYVAFDHWTYLQDNSIYARCLNFMWLSIADNGPHKQWRRNKEMGRKNG